VEPPHARRAEWNACYHSIGLSWESIHEDLLIRGPVGAAIYYRQRCVAIIATYAYSGALVTDRTDLIGTYRPQTKPAVTDFGL